MKYFVSLCLFVVTCPTGATEVDAELVLRAGLVALDQHHRGAPFAAGLTGPEVLVGFGLWLQAFWNHRPEPKGIRSEVGHRRDFIREAKRQIESGLTLAQLARRTWPADEGDLNLVHLLDLAVRPFGAEFDDVREDLEDWARGAKLVNVDCSSTLGTNP